VQQVVLPLGHAWMDRRARAHTGGARWGVHALAHRSACMHSCQAFTHAGVLQPRTRSTPRASRLERACTQRRTLVHRRFTHARTSAHSTMCTQAHTHACPQECTRTHASAHARPASTHAGVAAATNGPQGLAEWSAPRHARTQARAQERLHAAHSTQLRLGGVTGTVRRNPNPQKCI